MKNKQSIENLFEIFNAFSLFSGLKPNLLLCKIAVMQALKGVQVAACDMGCTDLCSEGRIVAFKRLAVSKIIFQVLITPVPTYVIKALKTI